MNVNEVGKLLGGSIVVYVVMAACSAASTPQFISTDGGGGSSGGATGDGSGGVLDALTDPVSSASADPNQSGTRLKLKYYAGADGSKLAAGMHDSMLSLDCQFLTMSDGTLRCVPVAGEALIENDYSDAACSKPLGIAIGCTGSAAYVYQESGCGVFHIFPVTGAYSGTSYYSGTPSSCSGPSPVSALPAGYGLVTYGAELPPSTFVQATVQTE